MPPVETVERGGQQQRFGKGMPPQAKGFSTVELRSVEGVAPQRLPSTSQAGVFLVELSTIGY